jgi:uncharacterized protein YpiB (UPF0302 family)
MHSPQLSGLIDAALEISRRRADTLKLIREACEREDKEEVLRLSRILVGLDDEQKAQDLGVTA